MSGRHVFYRDQIFVSLFEIEPVDFCEREIILFIFCVYCCRVTDMVPYEKLYVKCAGANENYGVVVR